MITTSINPFRHGIDNFVGIVQEAGVSITCEINAMEYRPTQLHLLPTGAVGDEPSVVIVGFDSRDTAVFTQLSMDMLDKAFKEIGYRIVDPKIVEKANKWDTLAEDIEKEYGFTNDDGEWEEYPDDDEDHDLCTIGEKAASAFGWLGQP